MTDTDPHNDWTLPDLQPMQDKINEDIAALAALSSGWRYPSPVDHAIAGKFRHWSDVRDQRPDLAHRAIPAKGTE